MSQVPFPAPGHDGDGDEPSLPGSAARDGQPPGAGPAGDAPGSAPVPCAGGDAASGGDDGDDFGAAEDLAWLEDIDESLIPPEGERGPAVTFALGEAADVDPVELARMAGPDGLGGQGFARGAAADALRPGPLLAALAEQAAGDPAGLGDDELLGMVSAARRLQNRAVYLELAGIAEFARRRAGQYAASVAGRARPGRRDGEFPDDELGMELVMSRRAAGDRMELADGLATRLPCTFAALAAGVIDGDRARIIWSYTRFLSDADAAHADRVLAAVAPGLKYEALAGRAWRLELRLDPEGVARRKEEARARGRRVETRRELSGNMCVGGRELAAAEALAVTAFNDADAAGLRAAGMAGSLRELRVLAFLDRLSGRDPFDRIPARGDSGHGAGPGGSGQAARDPAAGGGDSDGGGDEELRYRGDGDGDGDGDHGDEDAGGDGGEDHGPGGPGGGPGSPSGGPGGPAGGGAAPLPALINLIVPVGALFGWSDAAGEAGRWGLLDPADTRAVVQAASRHPRSRWCVTVVGPDGTAVAHGCSRGSHPWAPGGERDRPGQGQAGRGRARDGTAAARAGPPGAPRRAAPPRRRRATSTTPSPGRTGQRMNVISAPPAGITTTSSRPPAGGSSSQNRASCAGPRRPGAPTPPHPPSTTPRGRTDRCIDHRRFAGRLSHR